jgi:hypothetical protein
MAVEAVSWFGNGSLAGRFAPSRWRRWDQAPVYEMRYDGRIGIGVVMESLEQSGFERLAHGRKQSFFTAVLLELSKVLADAGGYIVW